MFSNYFKNYFSDFVVFESIEINSYFFKGTRPGVNVFKKIQRNVFTSFGMDAEHEQLILLGKLLGSILRCLQQNIIIHNSINSFFLQPLITFFLSNVKNKISIFTIRHYVKFKLDIRNSLKGNLHYYVKIETTFGAYIDVIPCVFPGYGFPGSRKKMQLEGCALFDTGYFPHPTAPLQQSPPLSGF